MMSKPTDHVSSDQLDAYIDGVLPVPGNDRVAEHLKECVVCKEKYAMHSRIDKSLRRIPLERTASVFTRSVMERLMVIPKASFTFKLLESFAYLFGLFIVVSIMLTAFVLTGVVDTGQVMTTRSVLSEVMSEVGSIVSALAEGLTGWLVDYLPFTFGKGTLSVSVFVVLVAVMLAIIDRLFGKQILRRS